jgi:pilus assembly protein CpaB
MEFAQKLISTRTGTIAVAGAAAVLAGIFILVYINSYRHSIKAQGAPVTVLVAKRLIPKGTSGTAAVQEGLFSRTTIRESQLRDGAFSDVASLRERVAARDVLAGQQLTSADFTAGAGSIAGTLSGAQRVIDIPLDSAHGLIGHVQPGDRVDVFVGFNVSTGTGQGYPVSRLLAQAIPVVDVAQKAGGLGAANSNTNVTLRVTDAQAQALAYATDNGKVWLVLRPPTGAPPVRPGLMSAATILLGVPPIQLPSVTRQVNRSVRQQLQKALAAGGQ